MPSSFLLPKWFPSLGNLQGEIMRAYRSYKRDGPYSDVLLPTVLGQTGHPRCCKKKPPVVAGRELRFSPDYSAHTLRRRLAFSSAMDQARAGGIEFFRMYPATLKIKSKTGAMETFQCRGRLRNIFRRC